MRKLWLKLGNVAFWMAWPALWVYLQIGRRTRLLLICGDEFLALKGWLGPGKWMLPGGGLHRGEDLVTGLLREVLEETGIRLKQQHVTPLFEHAYREYGLRARYVCFVCVLAIKPKVTPQRGEIVDYRWQLLRRPTLPLAQDAQEALRLWQNKGKLVE